jgi:starvation-inducible DNA-binding protein
MAHGDNSKKALADALNGLLADYYALYLKTKNFHWHVTGPHFREYHLLFDEQATELIATTDLVAERGSGHADVHRRDCRQAADQ